MKTFTELEKIGIVGTYREDYVLYVITRDAQVWKYKPTERKFELNGKLM